MYFELYILHYITILVNCRIEINGRLIYDIVAPTERNCDTFLNGKKRETNGETTREIQFNIKHILYRHGETTFGARE